MNYSINAFSIALFALSIICLIQASIISARKQSAGNWFSMTIMGVAIWAVAYGIELSAKSPEQVIFWGRVSYIGITFLPPLFLIFVVKFVGIERRIKPGYIALLFSMSIISLTMVWTNDFHHLHYRSVEMDFSGTIPLRKYQRGPWFIIHSIFFYLMHMASLILLVRRLKTVDEYYLRQNWAILIGAGVPLLGNAVYIFGLSPFQNLDLTPFAFLFTLLISGVALLRWGLFDIVPIAREKVISAMNDGLVVIDSRSRIVDVNKRMLDFLERESNSVLGKKLLEVIPVTREWYASIRDDVEAEFPISTEEGDIRYLEIKASSLLDQDSVYSGRLLLFRDITGRKKRQAEFKVQAQELGETNKLKDRLFSLIAHDLRDPMVSLKEILEMNQDGGISEEEFQYLLPLISKDVNYTVGMLENLLYWSRSQLQGETISPEKLDYSQMISKAVEDISAQAREKGIAIENTVENGEVVWADREMVQLILRNLLSNAVKFSNNGDRVVVSSSEKGGFTELRIEDSGVGIGKKTRDQLFSLETVSIRGTQDEQGTGLGLLLCKDFVEKNGGEIGFESIEGEGSTFFFTLQSKVV